MHARDARHPDKTLEDKLNAIYALRGGPSVAMGFRPSYLALLRALGDPHRHLPPVIHVAGTNGKGSVIAFMRAILEAAGYRVHAYTSPHLIRFNERIVLAGRTIEDAALHTLLDEVLSLAVQGRDDGNDDGNGNGNDDGNGTDLTFFEVTTALAFAAFARTAADIVLLETGLGGRLDCTNVIENPAVTAITHIGFDHMEFLGETIAAIAGEKAGIMKPGAPCIIGPQDESAVTGVFADKARTAGTTLIKAGDDWQCRAAADGIAFTDPRGSLTLPSPGLTGAHQIDNAGVALAALRLLEGFEIPDTAYAAGVREAAWPARLQKLPAGALYDNLPEGTEIWLDGSHNEAAARALAVQLKNWKDSKDSKDSKDGKGRDDKPLILICGMMKPRDPANYLDHLAPYAHEILTVTIADEPHAHDAATLAQAAGPDSLAVGRLEDALNRIREKGDPCRVLICGSLYLAGEALAQNG